MERNLSTEGVCWTIFILKILILYIFLDDLASTNYVAPKILAYVNFLVMVSFSKFEFTVNAITKLTLLIYIRTYKKLVHMYIRIYQTGT